MTNLSGCAVNPRGCCMDPVLAIRHLSKTFPGVPPFTAVHDVSFDLAPGEILGFLGPNGAGKTTTIQMLLGTLKPTSGSIHYFGQEFFHHRSTILQKVSFASTYLQLPKSLTVYENLDIFAKLYGLDKKQRALGIEKYLRLFDMWDFKDRDTRGLSAGQMTRVMLAKAFIPEPSIVLLDEPTASLDPDVCAEIRQFILMRQKELGTSMLFTSHNMAEVEEVCDRVLVLKEGRIIANEKPEILAKSVSHAKVRLLGVDRDLWQTTFLGKLSYIFHPHEVEITIEEENIGSLFSAIANARISFSQVSIDKPRLEDYFLTIAKK